MYDLFSQLMAGFDANDPIPYFLGWLTCIILIGTFFRFLYTLFKPY